MNLPELKNREDLKILLDQFYEKVKLDTLIGPIFNEKAQVNWNEHLPKIYDFWDALLFGAQNYRGRPFPPHIPLDLNVEHFERWLQLFFETVDDNFQGLKANEIKYRALNIGKNFLTNIERFRNQSER